MDSPFMETIAERVAKAGIRVACSSFPTCGGGAKPAKAVRQIWGRC
jgi:predicted alpha/beta-hydrolase family hydrolase